MVGEIVKLLEANVDKYFPLKQVKVGLDDQPYITAELKTLKRKRMREYLRREK